MTNIQESNHHLNGDFEMRQKNHQLTKLSKIRNIEVENTPSFKPDLVTLEIPNYLTPDKRYK